jgi:hypothetical protein
MIQKINNLQSFCGSIIVKGEGGDNLTLGIQRAVMETRNPKGIASTRMDGYTLVVVADVFGKAENQYLKYLKKNGKQYVNISEILNYEAFSYKQLIKKVQTIAKACGL